jgi:hypothetical protein
MAQLDAVADKEFKYGNMIEEEEVEDDNAEAEV